MYTRAPVPSRPIVLIVDDEPGMREVLSLGLQEHFDIETAGSTHEAELMMATRNYDVVVCDHLMPEEEGLPFLTRAKERYPKTQRIMITGYMNPELLSRCTTVAGLCGCLMKPVNNAELIQTIRLALPH